MIFIVKVRDSYDNDNKYNIQHCKDEPELRIINEKRTQFARIVEVKYKCAHIYTVYILCKI